MAKKNILLKLKKKKALALLRENHLGDAARLFSELSRSAPRDLEILLGMGFIEGKGGNYTAAVQYLEKAVSIHPDSYQAWYNLGVALRDVGELAAAIPAFEQAVRKGGGAAEALNCLAHAYLATGKLDRAIETFQRVLALQPDRAETHSSLGSVFQAKGLLAEAEFCYRKAISLMPGVDIAENLGSVLFFQGRFEEAEDVYRRGLERQPKNARLMSNLLLTLNYLPVLDQASVFEEHCKFNRLFSDQRAFVDFPNVPISDRRLKIAYVSPDFREHSVAYFIEPVIESHNCTDFEVYCYSAVSRPDRVTDRLELLTEHWISVAGLDPDRFAERIREDEIDILVDLAGHTARNSLTAFARQAAPVQVTWLGYPNTTGLKEIQYRIVDPVVDPSDQDAYYTEELVRLPGCFLCYKPPSDAPTVSSLPALESGQVTFGSFNNLSKINERTIRLWSEVIKAVPGSCLLLKNPSLTDEETRLLYQRKFLRHGVGKERIELIGHTPTRQEHLNLYGLVDIGLDTFPYNGTTTTCEALWMGVPVLTISGEYHAGRVGKTLSKAVGLSDWVSNSDRNFIDNAVQKSADINKLDMLRAGLRERMLASDLCDAARFTCNLEHAFRRMWRDWLC